MSNKHWYAILEVTVRASLLLEVVPQHPSRVLDNSHIGRNVGFVVLDQRHTLVFPGFSEESAHVIELGETPVSFVRGKSVSRN